jgi:activator of HSP90 ATPase
MSTPQQKTMSVEEQNAETARLRQRLMQVRLAARGLEGPRHSVTRRLLLKFAPQAVYTTLLDAARLSTIAGTPVTIDPRLGGEVTFGDGSAVAVITELLTDRHIVFAWQPRQIPWPEKLYATATFMLKPEGDGTALTFFGQDVPAEAHDDVARWWEEHYWQGLSSG